ncbi:MAG: ABC transporter substrate-binding protein [Candidatus Berkiella sp.]
MSMSLKKYAVLVLVGLIGLSYFVFKPKSSLPTIAIANYGAHASLEQSIQGIKDGLRARGFTEKENIQYEILDVNFDLTLIQQMLSKLRASHPKAIVLVSTPIAQTAKNTITDIPLIFTDITEPVAAGLLKDPKQPNGNLTGASDRQDLHVVLAFAQRILPKAKRVGLLYATSEANDIALVEMMKKAAKELDMEVVCIPVDHARDVPMRMQALKDKVDFMYVGVSGAIQPSLPAIVQEADRMNIPVFNANEEAVKQHQVLASFGVSYYQVGVNTAELLAKLLQDKPLASLQPIFPKPEDHQGFISKKRALRYGIDLASLTDVTVVE